MQAKFGDWLGIKGTTVDRPEHRGLITDIHAADGTPPYVVRWLDTDHLTTVFPGPDALVVSAEEQKAADEKASHRFGAMQAAIMNDKGK